MRDSLIFFQRPFPNANMMLLTGENPILADSGYGDQFKQTLNLIQSADTQPESLQMVVNTHWHCDHSGGNHHFQSQYNIPIAAHKIEAEAINQRDKNACDGSWLVQAVMPYTVDIVLNDGDVLDTGTHQWQVLHSPGHSDGHICLYCDGILIGGDTVHADDVAWLQTARYGVEKTLQQMLTTLEKLAKLPLKKTYSGHSFPTENPLERLDAGRRRYERWLKNPQSIGWHAMKRIFIYHLMLTDGLEQDAINTYLLSAPWFIDYAKNTFDTEPQDFIQPFLDEIERSTAGIWRDEKLLPVMDYLKTSPEWVKSAPMPDTWL